MPGIRWIVLMTTLALAGCGNDSAGSGGSVSAEAMGAGLDAGGYEISFSGSLADGGPWESERSPVSVVHNTYREQRARSDFGGRQGVERSEGEGPYMLRIQRLISRDGDEAQYGRVDIQLPPNARAGQTYSIKGRFYAEDGEAYAELVSPGALRDDGHTGWRENGNVGNPPISGELRIGEIGEVLTASFDIQVADSADHPRYAQVSGRVFQVPIESLEAREARTLRVPPPD
jgi:hypothetical protein